MKQSFLSLILRAYNLQQYIDLSRTIRKVDKLTINNLYFRDKSHQRNRFFGTVLFCTCATYILKWRTQLRTTRGHARHDNLWPFLGGSVKIRAR